MTHNKACKSHPDIATPHEEQVQKYEHAQPLKDMNMLSRQSGFQRKISTSCHTTTFVVHKTLFWVVHHLHRTNWNHLNRPRTAVQWYTRHHLVAPREFGRIIRKKYLAARLERTSQRSFRFTQTLWIPPSLETTTRICTARFRAHFSPSSQQRITFKYRPGTAHTQCSLNARILNQPASTRMYSSSSQYPPQMF